jgi:hypothetical protein
MPARPADILAGGLHRGPLDIRGIAHVAIGSSHHLARNGRRRRYPMAMMGGSRDS